ncbi:uncharacterized protein [Ptychodera flava]|uniref:uncharacterized protein n=1 Tax=Ptychodera flava TaxID=63121 RepID=UPI003969F9FE
MTSEVWSPYFRDVPRTADDQSSKYFLPGNLFASYKLVWKMNTFVAHPSVRMKGSENNWNPKQCRDSNCPQNAKGAHMHCPFCVKTESYHDPVILRAHFRVKHVDKGLDFAGLKVLRCCEQCEIIGAIKGEKKFKGAHWHCYKCRNGFNRRDEAMKHYKTHFRNPHTTFQIQIAQDIGSPEAWDITATSTDVVLSQSGNITVPSHISEEITIHPVLTEAVMTTSTNASSDSDVSLSKGPDTTATISANGLAVAATETVNSEGSGQAVILIESVSAAENVHEEETTIYRPVNDDAYKKDALDPKVELLEKQLAQAQEEKTQMEKQLRAEIQKLRNQVHTLTTSNAMLQQQLQCTQQTTLQRLPTDTQADLEQLVSHMEQQYSSLLHHHLGQLRQYYQAEEATDSAEEMSSSMEQATEYETPTQTASQEMEQIVVTSQSAQVHTVDIDSETVTTTALREMCRDPNRETDLVITEGHYVVKDKNTKDGMPELVIVEINNKPDTADENEEQGTTPQKRKSDSDTDDMTEAKRERHT